MNGYTASSAEIVTGALQDHDRARIIGTTTFGKGIGQKLHPLPDGYMLKLTEVEWLTPIGRSIQKDRTILDLYADPDSMESDSAIHARPTFKSDAGRLLYGGGGIVPDLIVRDVLRSDRGLMLTLSHSGSLINAVLARYAAEIQGKVPRHFVVTSTMRTEVVRRLRRGGLKVDDATLIRGRRYLDYLIGSQLTTHLFGDST